MGFEEIIGAPAGLHFCKGVGFGMTGYNVDLYRFPDRAISDADALDDADWIDPMWNLRLGFGVIACFVVAIVWFFLGAPIVGTIVFALCGLVFSPFF